MLGSPIPPQSRLVLSRTAFHCPPPSSQRLQHLLNVLSQVFLGPPLSSSIYKGCYQLDIHPFRIVGSRDWESPGFHPVSGGRWRTRLAPHAHSVLQTLEVPHPRAPSPNPQCLHTSPNLGCPKANDRYSPPPHCVASTQAHDPLTVKAWASHSSRGLVLSPPTSHPRPPA